jgi:hypothetical protein
VLNFMSGEVRHDRLFEFQLERLADGLRAIARK